ncbi:uncharacterized protein LOC121737199 [Aricia agestis]|uniref:uncharacterized protein LOC121737199 n=1 Tax=Aricia agestis TaxID=91739 RepID=UPI001C2052DA|nr:uncharacterized protein LOC121737199 [Aricia agestis]
MNAKVFFIAFAFLCLAYTIEAGVVRRSADDNITTPTINITSTTTEDNVQNKVGENKPEDNDQSKKDQEATTKAAEAADATTGAAASNPGGQDKIDTTTANSTLTEEQLKEKENAVGGLVALWWLLNLLKGGQ